MAEKPHFCSVENVGFVSGRVLVFRLQAWEAWDELVAIKFHSLSVSSSVFLSCGKTSFHFSILKCFQKWPPRVTHTLSLSHPSLLSWVTQHIFDVLLLCISSFSVHTWKCIKFEFRMYEMFSFPLTSPEVNKHPTNILENRFIFGSYRSCPLGNDNYRYTQTHVWKINGAEKSVYKMPVVAGFSTADASCVV